MNTNEFYRIPTASIIGITSGHAKPFQIEAARRLGRTMNPVVVTLKGMNRDTFSMEYEIATNGVMAEVAAAAGLEYVDAFLINPADLESVKDLF